MKRYTLLLPLAAVLLSACHESLERRAEREAREYTEKYCPTPFANSTRTDSVTFEVGTKTYHYYCTLKDNMDDPAVINKNRKALHDRLLKGLAENTAIKVYKEAGFSFAYTLRSAKNPALTLYQDTFTPKDYNR